MKRLGLVLLLVTIKFYAQDAVDIGTPARSPFNLGGDIQGVIQNSVNEVTGKVTFSLPLGTIGASTVSYGLNLTYNGQSAFKNGKETNKYNPTSVVGVGFSLSVPKIMVDNKGTGTMEDDDFYLLDGGTSSKLICTNKDGLTGAETWEFQMEKYSPWKIKFYKYNLYYEDDYWTIVKEDGLTYKFGASASTSKSKESVIRWGNWIGSSLQSGGTQQTIVWNLSSIEDQFENVSFQYELEEIAQSGSVKQTEASYLKKISSSNGASIQLTYGTKGSLEYYEPHKEKVEPDAYQERYEKKYLQSVSSYNNANELVSTYNIGYTLNGSSLNTKRYLTSLTQTAYNNGQSEVMPSQTFDYHYTGTFKGGIKTITYPTGGAVTYNYKNKFLFNNYSNQFETSAFSQPSGYMYHSMFVSDNYGIFVYRTENKISGDKYRFKFFRVWWTGQKWEWEEFTFPHLMLDPSTVNEGGPLKDLYPVLERDYYGFVYDKGTAADIYLWHLENDGRTWDYYTTTNKSIGSTNPRFHSGDEFVALQNYSSGELYTYVWNGSSWNYKLIDQGSGKYYITATNNYIMSLNEEGGTDYISGVGHTDRYYFHYLDAQKNWQSKSWSAEADPYIDGTEAPSYFYPDNSIIGFVADDNPELFLRWDTNYNLTNVDNVLGSYNDSSPMVPVGNGMFTIHSSFYKNPNKSARFNGVNWSVSALPSANNSYYSKLNFGEDIMLFQNNPSISGVGYHKYNPNTNSWTYATLNSNYSSSLNNYKLSTINSDFIIASNKIYERTNLGVLSEIGTLQYDNSFSYSDGLRHSFVRQLNGGNYQGVYYYINKETGLLSSINTGSQYMFSSRGSKMGGYTSFMSPSSIWLRQDEAGDYRYFYRIIDDKINNSVYDIVVNHIDINDDNGGLRKVQYTYNKPKCSPDNSSTFYGEVIIENKGVGTGNIGKVVKRFNDGSTDLSMVGLPLEVLTIDANNKVVKRTTTTWNKYSKSIYNGSGYFYKSYYIRPTIEKEELFFEESPKIVNTKTYSYNTYGLKTGSTTTDSKGESMSQNITYAYQQYSFVEDKNMLSFPYMIYTKEGNYITLNVEQSKWIEDNGKVYVNENWSGPATNKMRLNNQVSKVETTTGNVLESNNGKGIYSTALFGYNNLYNVATVNNATYQEVIDELDVTYYQLQGLSTSSLKTELLKLYDRLPNASISLKFYDSSGRVISKVDERKEEVFIYYDTLGREDYVTDAQGNILEKKNYHFAN